MSGSRNETLYGKNVDFSGAAIPAPTVVSNGQLLIGSSVAPNIRVGMLQSLDGSITWTVGNGTITGQVTGGSTVIKTITGDSGGPESPSGGNFNILGSGSITVAGSANTETISLTGLTSHAVLVGAGTSTITKIAATANTGAVLQNNSGADPSYSTATYPSTTTINQILYSSANNVVSELTTTNRASLSTNATGVPTWLALTDGQLVIGSTAGAPAAANLSAGTGISIVNASNSVTINSVGGGVTWSDQGASVSVVSNSGSFSTASVTLTTPASPSNGDVLEFVNVFGASLVVKAAGTQIISITGSASSAGGTQTSGAIGDSLRLVYRATATTWWCTAVNGNWTPA